MSTPLRDLLHDLLFDGSARAAFAATPEQYLADHGWDELRGQDVGAALDALTAELPPDQAARIAPLAADDSAFDEGLGGAIAGLEAAVAAIDGDIPVTVVESLDAHSTLDTPHTDDATVLDLDDLARSDDLDDLDELDLGEVEETADLDDVARSDDLDELAFGTEEHAPAIEADLPEGSPSDVTAAGGDPAAGIDFPDDAPDAEGDSAFAAAVEEPGAPGDEPPDDVID